jgi:hypothetical protein
VTVLDDAAGSATTGGRRPAPWIPLLGLLAIAIYLALTPTGGWDIWWHLQTGEVALEQRSTLPTDPFSFSFAGQPWGHKDLLAAVILYLGFAGLGFAWFSLLKALVVAGVGVSIFALGRRARAPDLVSTALAGLAIVALQYRMVERPVLFSLALFPVLLLLLERLRDVRDTGRRPTIASRSLAVVMLIWGWSLLHREALIGIGVFGLEVVAAWAARLLGRAPGPSNRYLVAVTAGLCLAAALPLISPSGVDFYTTSFAVARSDALREAITDWASIGPLELLGDFPITAVLLLLALAGAIAVVRRVRAGLEVAGGVGLAHLFALLLFTAATLVDCVRWLPYASSLAAIVALRGFGGELAPLGRSAARSGDGRGTLVLVLLVVAVASWWQNVLGTGVGPMRDRFPDGAVAFADEHGLDGEVVNAFHLGGYLLWKSWPGTRVLIDGRNDLVYPPEFLLRVVESQRREEVFEQMRADDGATWVVAGNIPGHLSHAFLARSPDWMLVYWSEPAVIYVKREAHRDLAHLELEHVDPVAVDASIVGAMQRFGRAPERLKAIGEEVRRMLEASPESLRANTAAVLYFHFRGPRYHARRDEVLERLRAIHAGHPAVVELERRLGGQPLPRERDPQPPS